MEDSEDPFDEGLVQPSIVKQFHSILEQYPDNGQILKELIQNAEDAGAGTVKFLIDHTQYDQRPEKLLFPSLAKQQGPALYAYNDAVFRDEDWRGIRMIQDSIKANDPLKVGRFGLGFKSVFHLTDLPGVVSNDKVAFIDPQAAYLKRNKTLPQTGEIVPMQTTSRAWKLSSSCIEEHPSQIEPFIQEIFNLKASNFRQGSYQGTVFRFPLRGAGVVSDISATCYTVDKLHALCKQFEEEAHLLLLFLKHVHTVEVYEKAGADKKTQLIQTVKITNDDREQLLTKRLSFNSTLNSRPLETHTSSYILDTVYSSSKLKSAKRRWLVTQHYGGDTPSHIREKSQCLPLVGVALPLTSERPEMDTGHTFCFLPMPRNDDNLTGLGVHVNGYFEVNQSRTHLKWPERTTYFTCTNAESNWNSYLIGSLLPAAMWNLIAYAVRQRQYPISEHNVYNIMPNSNKIRTNWKPLLQTFWKSMNKQECLFTILNRWQNPRQCYLVPHCDSRYSDLLDKVCGHDNMHLVHPPQHVYDEVKKQQLSDSLTRQHVSEILLRDDLALSETERLSVLQYLYVGRNPNLLLGLKLLKREDGAWVKFTYNGSPVYLETEVWRKSLLPDTTQTFMASCKVGDTVYNILKEIAETRCTQVVSLTSSNFPQVLKKAFGDLQSYRCASPPQRVEFDWLANLWSYIKTHYSGQIDMFEGLPIVPERKKKWSALLRNIPFIATESDSESLSDLPIEKTTLISLGIRVVGYFHKMYPNMNIRMLKTYIGEPNAAGVLDAFLKIPETHLIKAVEKLNHQDKIQLLETVSQVRFTKSHVQLLQKLPLLLCYPTERRGEEVWKTKATVDCAASLDLPVFIPRNIVKSSVCGTYARKVGVKDVTSTQVLVDIIFPAMKNKNVRKYHQEEIETLMITVIDNFDSHKKDIQRFEDHIKDIPFVKDGSGCFSPPNKLLDPMKDETRKMFCGLDVFPSGIFADYKYAMKLSDHNCFHKVDDEKLLLLARYLDGHACDRQLVVNGEKLQSFIRYNVSHITPTTFQELTSLKWIPVKQEGPKHYPESVPWFGCSSFFSNPDSIMAEEFEYMVGSVKPIAKDMLHVDVTRRLQCDRQPSSEIVMQHLRNVTMNFKGAGIPPLRMLKKVYDYISLRQNAVTYETLKDEHFQWIWTGKCFTDIHHITLSKLPFDMEPYAYHLPDDLAEYSDMFTRSGAKSSVVKDTILVQIKDFHDRSTTNSPTQDRMRRDFQICQQVLDLMEREGCLTSETNLPIPVECGENGLKLVECKQCTYCEDDSISINDIEEDLHLVHRDIPKRVVKALGVPNMMSRYLNAEELAFPSYGQGEPLTRRIHSLLDDYKDGFAVLKELIQNADDAEATEVHFIYDKRDFTKASKSLIDPEMKPLQGPALLCYNNKVFTDDDFENIVKLSGATKKEKVDKIGRFGLGFNVVYNLTDVPSFISQDSIVYFDPHMKYLRQAIKDLSKPGIKLSLKDHASRIHKLKDQFQVFHGLLGCDLQSATLPRFDGTLFRFPLRTVAQADESDISKTYYGENEVRELFQLLQKTAQYMLLFTQHVSSVKVSEIHMDCKPVICAEISKRPIHLLRSMEFGNQEKVPGTYQREKEFKILKHASKRGSDGNTAHGNIIIEVTASFKRSVLYAEESSQTSFWNISSAVGPKTIEFDKDSIPVGAVAVNLRKEGHARFVPEALDSKYGGFMFCFLPLPIHNQLTVHINGYFAVTPSRRQLCTQEHNDKRDPKAGWNEFIMQGVIQEAYTAVFTDMTQRPDIYDPGVLQEVMVHFFPKDIPERIDGNGNLLHLLCKSFYRHIVSDPSVKLFHDGNKWTNFESMRYLDSSLLGSSGADVMVRVCKLHFKHQLDQDFVNMPQSVIRQMDVLGFHTELHQHQITLITFYRDIFLPMIHKVKQEDRDGLVRFALLFGNKELNEIVKQASCIPVTCSESLFKPGQLVDPAGPLKDLYTTNDGPFPKWLLESKITRHVELQQALIALGMRVENITCDEALERAFSISKMKDGTKRVRCLLKLISHKIQKETDTEEFDKFVKDVRGVAFLPVAKKPNFWKLPWKGETQYVSPDDSFMETQKELVGCSEVIASFPGTKEDNLMNLLNCVKHEVTEEQIRHQVECVVQSQRSDKGKDFDKYSFETNCRIMNAIYKFMEDNANSKSDMQIENFKKIPFIMLANGEIVSPDSCAFSCPLFLNPHFHEIPQDFHRIYKNLCEALHIRPYMTAADIVDFLQKLHDENIGNPMTKNVCKLACDAAIYLSECKDLGESNFEEQLFLPDLKGIMTRCTELCFNNCPWIPVDDKSILHRSLSFDVAESLGVKSIRAEALSTFQHGIPFGQSEKLTNRIKRILEGYPCDKEILQELLQNADDAEANVVHFFLDYRTHPSEKAFEGWQSVAGPALLVYNNKPFRKRDMEGIKNLGEGSKSSDPVTTGKYGVGFNCVYHLTDTPMFLTPDYEDEGNHVLVVFDPNCSYISGCTPAEPGQKYSNAARVKDIFPDVFRSFTVPGKTFTQGTLFRFPLRTREMAATSSISDTVTTTDHMTRLFKTFSSNLEQCLLFLQNVKEITLNEIHGDNEVKVVDRVLGRPTQKNEGLTYNLRQYAEKEKMITLLTSGCYKHHYELEIRKHQRKDDTKWLVLQQLGVRERGKINTRLLEKYRNSDAVILPKGGVAVQLSKRETFQKGKLFCLLPLPVCTELPMHINGSFMLDHESRHNLLQTEDTTSFGFLWNEMILKEIIADLYIDAMELVAESIPSQNQPYDQVTADISFFSNVFPSLQTSDPYLSILQEATYCKMAQRMASFFPVIRYTNKWINEHDIPTVDIDWYPVCSINGKTAYFDDIENQLIRAAEPVQKIPLFQHFFPSKEQEKQEQDQKRVFGLRKTLANSRFPLTQLDLKVRDALKKYVPDSAKVHKLSPAAILLHFCGDSDENYDMKVPTSIENTPFSDTETFSCVLAYCKSELAKHLDNLPMLLMSNGTVQQFSTQSTILLSEYHELVPAKQDMFASQIFLSYMDIDNMKKFLKPMTCQDLSTILHHRLDKDIYKGVQKMVPFDTTDKVFGCWINKLWNFIGSETISVIEGKPVVDSSGLESLQNWSIFPVQRELCYLAPPMKYFNIVINLAAESNPMLVKIFRGMKVPEPYLPNAYCGPGLARVINNLVTSLSKAEKVVACLSKAMDESPLHFDALALSYDCEKLLDYFKENLSCLKKVPETAKATLYKLPIFESVSGLFVKLDGHQGNLFRVSVDIPKHGMEKCCTETHKLYLKNKPKYKELHTFLGFKELTFVDAYVKHILCHFEVFNEKERFMHLQKIKRFVEDNPNHETQLLRKLKEVPFLQTTNGLLQRPRENFDPYVPLFKEMEHSFPTGEFAEPEWISFLKKIGLQHEVDTPHLVVYAKKIAKLTKRDDLVAAEKKCKLLLKALFEKDALVQDSCLQIKSIHFIPYGCPNAIHLELCDVYKTNGSPFVCFQDSMLHEHANLVWSQTSVLPSYATPKNNLQKERLSVNTKPSLERILDNLCHVCERYKTLQNPLLRYNIKQFLKNVYGFIMKNHLRDDLGRMSVIPCVAVENGASLVTPPQIAVGLRHEIPPYLYGLPLDIGEHVELVHKAGATLEVTIEQYADVLIHIYHHAKEGPLEPNELAASLQAVAGFITLGKIPKNSLDWLTSKTLYVLTENKILRKASDVVFMDTNIYNQRVKCLNLPAMMNFYPQFFDYDIMSVLERLPDLQKPKYLSQVLSEQLDTASGDLGKTRLCLQYEEKLSSSEFQTGIVRVIRHKQQGTQNETEVRNNLLLAGKLKSVNFYEVGTLSTSLLYLGQRVSGSERSSPIFLDKSEGKLTIYINASRTETNADSARTRLHTLICEVINEIMENKTATVNTYIIEMLQTSPNKMSRVLDDLQIRPYSTSCDDNTSPSSSQVPGTYIPVELHDLLQPCIVHLRVDEYVGYEEHDPCEELDHLPGDNSDAAEAVYILAKVMEEVAPQGATSYLNYSYKINVGSGEQKVVHATTLYRFCRQKERQTSTENNPSLALILVPESDHEAEDEDNTLPRRSGHGHRENTSGHSRPSEPTPQAADNTSTAHASDEIFESSNIDAIKAEIRKILQEAWTMEETHRKKVVKRLWLQWHPDKNQNRADLATKVFQYIQWAIDQLEKGLPLLEKEQHNSSNYTFERRTNQGFWDEFNFEGFSRRAHSHGQRQRRDSDNFWSSGSTPSWSQQAENPQLTEARRWMKQANYDLASVTNDVTGGVGFHEWACLKCHHAAEKALKATQFAVDADDVATDCHNLQFLYRQVPQCAETAQRLQSLLGDRDKMCYPSYGIPHNNVTAVQSGEATCLAKEVVDSCQIFLDTKR